MEYFCQFDILNNFLETLGGILRRNKYNSRFNLIRHIFYFLQKPTEKPRYFPVNYISRPRFRKIILSIKNKEKVVLIDEIICKDEFLGRESFY